MSIPLLKREMKSNYKILILFMGIITLYSGIITAMYDPKLGAGINALAESMPEFFAVFGMENPGVTLLDFLNNYLYGFILLIIPFICTIILSYKLVAKYIDKGSMAYLLNTHYSRSNIIFTQFIVLISGVILLVLYATVLIIVCSEIMFKGELEIEKFLMLNFGLVSLEIFLAAMCFLFACLFNEIKFSVGLGAGIGLIFFLIQMLSQVNKDIEFLKYFTPLTLFDAEKIIKYDSIGFLYIGVLWLLSGVFLTIGIKGFKKRDLPL